MKKCINGYFICLLMAIICFVLVDNMHLRFNRPVINHTDTVVKEKIIEIHDSFEIIKPIPKIIEKLRVDTFFSKNGDSIILAKENKKYIDTIVCAGDSMEVTNYISGYEAALDSLKVKLSKRDTVKTITLTKYVTLQDKKSFISHFKFNAGVGYGYGLKNKELEPFIGISFGYNF